MSYGYVRPARPDEIYHYGVMGMKWGVRRYQNADGTLTSAGKKHYNKQANKAVKKERKEETKNRRTMSDEEIQKRIDRLNLEKRYKDLSDQDINAGRAAVNNAFSKAGKVVMTAAVVGGLAYAGRLAIKKQVPKKAVKAIVRVAKSSNKRDDVKKIAKNVFNKERMWKEFDNINWDEVANFMFPNPNKKK